MWSKWQRWIAFFVVVTEQKKNIDNHFGMTTEYGNAPLFLRKKRSVKFVCLKHFGLQN